MFQGRLIGVWLPKLKSLFQLHQKSRTIMHLSTLCNRLNSAARFFPKSCFKSSSYANMQSWGAISVCLLADRPKVGGSKSTVLQRFHNTSKYNHNLATFSSLTQAQSRDQYPVSAILLMSFPELPTLQDANALEFF